MIDKLATIIRNARINASPLSQVGYAEADALIENGVILLPCKVGDIVYRICGTKNRRYVASREVLAITVLGNNNCIIHTDGAENQLGKTVFLTEEEAEKALRGEEE